MKQIIIEPEWLGILENQSPEFLARVTSAIFAFFLHDTQPSGLSQAEQVAYDFLLNNILRYQQQYDLDAGYEAVIKRKRAAEARAKKSSLKSAGKAKAEAHPKLIVPVETKENYKTVPPVTDGELNLERTPADDYPYARFRQFYATYIGQKDSCDLEYARFRHRYPEDLSQAGRLFQAGENRYKWARDLAKAGFHTPPLPPMAEWLEQQGWNNRLPAF